MYFLPTISQAVGADSISAHFCLITVLFLTDSLLTPVPTNIEILFIQTILFFVGGASPSPTTKFVQTLSKHCRGDHWSSAGVRITPLRTNDIIYCRGDHWSSVKNERFALIKTGGYGIRPYESIPIKFAQTPPQAIIGQIMF